MRYLTPLCVLLVGCSTVSLNAPSTTTIRPPEEVVGAAERTFRAHAIPVDRVDYFANRVRSGTFDLGPIWNGEATEARVDCGVDSEGEPIARNGGIELDIEMEVGATRVRIREDGTPEMRWRVRIDSWGEVVGSRDTRGSAHVGASCRLTSEFADRLIRLIAGVSPVEPNGTPGVGGIPRPPSGLGPRIEGEGAVRGPGF